MNPIVARPSGNSVHQPAWEKTVAVESSTPPTGPYTNTHLGFFAMSTLHNLPIELVVEILKGAPLKDILNITRVRKSTP